MDIYYNGTLKPSKFGIIGGGKGLRIVRSWPYQAQVDPYSRQAWVKLEGIRTTITFPTGETSQSGIETQIGMLLAQITYEHDSELFPQLQSCLYCEIE